MNRNDEVHQKWDRFMQPLRHGYTAGFDPECYPWPRFIEVDRDYIWIVNPILFSLCYFEPPLSSLAAYLKRSAP